MKAISSGRGFTISMPASWPHRLPSTVKVVPNSATRLMLARTSSAADRLDDLDQRHGASRFGSAMQMCGVTAGSTAACAPARSSRSMKPAR